MDGRPRTGLPRAHRRRRRGVGGQRARQVGIDLDGRRERNGGSDGGRRAESDAVSEPRALRAALLTRVRSSGYVALAVAGAEGVHVKEVETGYGDRERNMVAFAKESLLLLMDAMRGAKPNL